MKIKKLTLAVAATLTAGVATSALAMDLYVDTKTKQIYAEPGKGRQKLGTYEKVDGMGKSAANVEGLYQEVSKERAQLQKLEQDFEAEHSHIKALDEHVAANKEAMDKNKNSWYNKISLRGYSQLRWNQPLNGDATNFGFLGDSNTAGDNKNFSFRRVRFVFQGDINEYLYLYVQPDFATNTGAGADNNHFAQLRDAYADIHFDKKHEYRIRAGQSKVPFGWENMQSSQNRLTMDRSDPVNSAVASERDLGLFAYWTPEHVQKLWKRLAKDGLKTSGDYGIAGFGIYNGQGINKAERNDDLYMVAHTSYPFELDSLGSMLGMGDMLKGQVFEMGVDALSGRHKPSNAVAPAAGFITAPEFTSPNDAGGNLDERVGVHAILFPQPFGLQAEWTWGKAGNYSRNMGNAGWFGYQRESLDGGYVMAMYKIDKIFRSDDHLIPYVKWQTYDGVWRNSSDAPRISTDELDVGFEWQIMKPLELQVSYATAERTRSTTGSTMGTEYGGDMIRTQLQWNY